MTNMLDVAMRYHELETHSLDALSYAVKARSEGDLDLACAWNARYAEARRELSELGHELSKLPVPARIAKRYPLLALGHDDIAKLAGGHVPGCACAGCLLGKAEESAGDQSESSQSCEDACQPSPGENS